MRTTETHTFTRADLERAAKFLAKAAIVGRQYVGDFHSQQASWNPDGSVSVATTHTPFEWVWTAQERRDRAARAGR